MIEQWIDCYHDDATYYWGIYLKDGEMIGSIGVTITSEYDLKGELGYKLGSRWWNQGYSSEAAKAVIPEFNLRFYKTGDEKVLIILNNFKGDETPYYYSADGDLEAYVRVGNESVKATPTELKRLVLRGKNTSYDSQNSTYKVEDYAYSQLRARYKKMDRK